METVKRYTEQEQLLYLGLWKECGLSQRALCEQQGIGCTENLQFYRTEDKYTDGERFHHLE
jgi:hypothetical protein